MNIPLGLFDVIRVTEEIESFSSRYFDHQLAKRFLFKLNDCSTIESSLYKHYKDGKLQDISIDISTMIGCPIRCKYCAAASLKYERQLTTEEMIEQVLFLLNQENISSFPKINCSFQGIGEPSLLAKSVFEAGYKLLMIDKRCVLSISTTAANLNGVRFWRKENLPLDNLQFSSPLTNQKNHDLSFPKTPRHYDLIEEIHYCAESLNIQKVKYNYILIEGVNDRNVDIETLIKVFSNSSVIVKISSLNQTRNSLNNAMKQGTKKRADEISLALRENGIDSYVFGAFDNTTMSCGQLTFFDWNQL